MDGGIDRYGYGNIYIYKYIYILYYMYIQIPYHHIIGKGLLPRWLYHPCVSICSAPMRHIFVWHLEEPIDMSHNQTVMPWGSRSAHRFRCDLGQLACTFRMPPGLRFCSGICDRLIPWGDRGSLVAEVAWRLVRRGAIACFIHFLCHEDLGR